MYIRLLLTFCVLLLLRVYYMAANLKERCRDTSGLLDMSLVYYTRTRYDHCMHRLKKNWMYDYHEYVCTRYVCVTRCTCSQVYIYTSLRRYYCWICLSYAVNGGTSFFKKDIPTSNVCDVANIAWITSPKCYHT